jgi:hypothetical protein
MNQNNLINYNFYYWGPLLFKTTIDDELCNSLLERGKNLKLNFRDNLAGHIEKELLYTENDKKFFVEKVYQYFYEYTKTYENYYDIKFNYIIELKNMWINFMKKYEDNPYHIHSEDLSFVIFLQIPEKLKKEYEEYHYHKGKGPGPGTIQFIYGQNEKNFISTHKFLPKEKEMFIFPANLMHQVYSFKSDCERISVSGNLTLKEKI